VVASASDGPSQLPTAGLSLSNVSSKFSAFVDENFIPIALLTAASFGWMVPRPGEIAMGYKVQKLSTIGQFVISGMVLQASQVAVAIKSPLPIIYGVLSILFVTPLLGIAVMSLPWIHPFEFKVGMAVFCCVPTTLSSCVALTNQCNGNAAVALMLVVLTSTLGVFTIPTVLGFVLGSTSLGPGAFNQRELLKTLIVTVLCPLFVGIGLQSFKAISNWKDNNKKVLARMSTMFLCITPWLQLSMASTAQLPIGPRLLLTGVALGVGVHVAFLVLNMTMTSWIRFNKDPKAHIAVRKAIILCTSEKTLPVAVAVISQLGVLTPATMAFAILPCIFSHILQTVIDSALVSHWNNDDGKLMKN
jgi:sodium/bile acid cotransporter 7